MKNFSKYLPYIFTTSCIILVVGILYVVYHRNHKSNILTVAFLDIGQGDAIYIEAPNSKQILVDAGPGPIVLQKLAQIMPFADRSIDMLVVTNPDKDHIAGFVDVLEKYKVGYILEPGTPKDTLIYKKLEEEITTHNVKKDLARRGMHVVLDKEKNIYFDILFPDRDVSTWSPNDGSIVGKLIYGSESFMLMGDATKGTENLVIKNENESSLRSQVLKLGHHGSRTSSSNEWLKVVHPDVAIISAGLHNRYGHPHQEVLDSLTSLHIPYLATYQKGNIVFKTDGAKLMH